MPTQPHVPAIFVVALVGCLILILFSIWPLAATLVISFTDFVLLLPGIDFVSFDNYQRAAADPRFISALKVTAAYTTFTVASSTIIGLLLATALRQPGAWSALMKTGFVLPAILPGIVAATVWLWLLEPELGVANQVLAMMGFTARPWLTDPSLALPSLIALGIWREAGLAMIIFTAGLARIPPEIEEAAKVDGASNFARWRLIVVPLLRPATLLIVGATSIRSLEMFTPAFVMTGGGPAGATTTWTYLLYVTGFERFQFGYAAAMSIIVSLVTIVILYCCWRWMRRNPGHYL